MSSRTHCSHLLPIAHRLLLLALVAWLLAGAVGCQPGTGDPVVPGARRQAGSSRPRPTPLPASIRFAYASDGSSDLGALVAEFNEHYPMITVELVPKVERELRVLRAETADVMETYPSAIPELVERGAIRDLDPWMTRDESFDRDDVYESALDLYRADGKTWAIPQGIDPLVVHYNGDLFDERGVAHPDANWDLDAFLATASAVRDAEHTVYGYAYGLPSWSFDSHLFVYRHGGALIDDWHAPTRATFARVENVEALEWWSQLSARYDVAPSPDVAMEAFGGNKASTLFYGIARGQVGMWIDLYSLREGRDRPTPWTFTQGIAPLPRDERAVTLAMGYTMGYVISSATPHADACWEWLYFLSHRLPPHTVPARRSLIASEAYAREVGEEAAAVAHTVMEGEILYHDRSHAFNEFKGFGDAIDHITSGFLSPKEAMEWAQTQAGR